MKIAVLYVMLSAVFVTAESASCEANSPVMSLTMWTAQMSSMGRKYLLRKSEICPAERLTSKCPVDAPLFRTADGSCNNINRPSEGQSFTAFKRFVKPAYDDDKGRPRISSKRCTGSSPNEKCLPLPSPRSVSTTVHFPKNSSSKNSIMLMQWGQFIDHDFTATAAEQLDSQTACCDNIIAQFGGLHPDILKKNGKCFTISIPKGDRFFTKRCMEFVRSSPAVRKANAKNPREQINMLTSFIDASNVYGSTEEQQNRLRAKKGRMKTSPGRLLPRGSDDDCIVTKKTHCFDAGDDRVNVFPGLTALHTVFVRLHNTIVAELQQRKKRWSGERLFQETRKIVGALIQRFTFEEFLGELLNDDTRNKYCLYEGNYRYNSSIDPSIANVFATAAFRYGHSLIPNALTIRGREIPVRILLNNPQFIFTDLKEIVQNILSSPGQARDKFFTNQITDHLFENANMGFDLVSLNIQRGRDHGLPSYNEFRKFCGLKPVTLDSTIWNKKTRNALKKVYEDSDDIDVFTGGMIEPSLKGGQLGETFSCILGRQFSDLKFGDSFWYETTDRARGFTPGQLASIKKMTLAKVLCEEFGLKKIQKNPFLVVSRRNPEVKCSKIPGLDLRPW